MAIGYGCPFLPDDMITEIFKRLPVEPIVRMRCVCKRWKIFFKSPDFITQHLSHSDRNNPFLLLREFNHNVNSSLHLLNHDMETVEVLRVPPINSFRRQEWKILGSSNGLLCVRVNEDEKNYRFSLFLWNPAIREVREVTLAYHHHQYLISVGFGFSSVINDYKIVLFSCQRLYAVNGKIDGHIEVYSLSTDSWKELDFESSWGTVDDLVRNLYADEHIYFDGTIFWLNGIEVVSFDIVSEVITITPIQTDHGNFPFGLHVYDNELTCHSGDIPQRYEHISSYVSVMEEVASESGKILKSTQRYWTQQMPHRERLRALCIWRNELVFVYAGNVEVDGDPNCFLYLIDLITNEDRTFNCSRTRCYVVNYEKSLVSVQSAQAE